ATDQGAGASADINIEFIDRGLLEEWVDRAEGADLIGGTGYPAAGEDKRGLAALHSCLVAYQVPYPAGMKGLREGGGTIRQFRLFAFVLAQELIDDGGEGVDLRVQADHIVAGG